MSAENNFFLFPQESKTGLLLVSKCRMLRDENESLARQVSEGKVQKLEAQVAQLRTFLEDFKKSHVELEEHCSVLDEENEELQQLLFVQRRQVRE